MIMVRAAFDNTGIMLAEIYARSLAFDPMLD